MKTVKYHMNDVIEKHQNKPKDPVQTVKKKDVLITTKTSQNRKPALNENVGSEKLHLYY